MGGGLPHPCPHLPLLPLPLRPLSLRRAVLASSLGCFFLVRPALSPCFLSFRKCFSVSARYRTLCCPWGPRQGLFSGCCISGRDAGLKEAAMEGGGKLRLRSDVCPLSPLAVLAGTVWSLNRSTDDIIMSQPVLTLTASSWKAGAKSICLCPQCLVRNGDLMRQAMSQAAAHIPATWTP